MLLKNSKLFYSFLLILFANYLPVFGQQSQVQFGKNRIQYKAFNWQYLSTYNFDIYYYEGGREIAQNAAKFAESDYQKIIDQTSFTPYSKIKLLVYNSASDMQQSNIGLEDQDLLVGGQTNFVKSKIEVAFEGNQNEFRADIRFGISAMIINVMLYGGSLKDIVQSSYLLSLPDWYVSGAAAYISEGWSLKMDNYVRGIFVDSKFRKPSMLNGREATIAGQSIWNFIAERYGKVNIGNILNLTRILRNEEASIESTLGVPYSVFIREWAAYYSGMANAAATSYEKIKEENKIIKKNNKNSDYKNIDLNPDGKLASYVKSYKGKYYIYIHDLESGKRKMIHQGGQKLLNQQEDDNIVSTSWQSPEVLAFIEKRKNKIRLNFYNISKGKNSKRNFKDFNQVLSFSFSENGEKMVLSADKKGQSDIFLYDLQNNSFKQLTNDLYDDLSPCFSKGNSSIIFSSNRDNDTLNKGVVNFRTIRNSYDIFIYQTSGNSSVLKRITDYGVNSKPRSFDKGNILYLSSEKGINNLYKYNLASGTSIQVSRFLYDIEDYDVNPLNKSLVFSALDKGSEYLYYYKEFNFNNSFAPALTERQRTIEEAAPRKIEIEVVNDTIRIDTAKAGISDDEIDINNYRFESDIKKEGQKDSVSQTFVFNSKPKESVVKDAIRIKGPSKYQNNFGVERVNSTLMIDPLRGLGVLMEANMADMMGNHRINAGLFGLTDLKSSNIFGEYLYLKNRIDYKVRYDRSTIFAYDEVESQRYTMNKAAFTASYPLGVSQKISFSPFIMGTRFTNLDINNITFFSKDVNHTYLGGRAEYVFDNTLITGMNMIEGTRCKIGIEKSFNTRDESKNFGKFVFDLRHYQPLHKELILATRISYGEFFGRSRKNFLLGGMDNWLFNSTTRHGADDPLNLDQLKDNSDLLFLEYVTNMRGFNYSTQFGAKYVLFNAELRMPIIKYLYKGVINSNFLKNLQFVAFTDIGSSWSGKSPFTTDNSTNTTTVGGGSNPFTAKVINYKSPFLVGYGVGARTMFLGYYVKLDMAFGVQDNVVQDRRFYLTFGYDF